MSAPLRDYKQQPVALVEPVLIRQQPASRVMKPPVTVKEKPVRGTENGHFLQYVEGGQLRVCKIRLSLQFPGRRSRFAAGVDGI